MNLAGSPSRLLVAWSTLGLSMAFTAVPNAPMSPSSTTALMSSTIVDPSTLSKKDYQDICGVSFNSDELITQRLHHTTYLYPKHVEVIQDIEPIANEQVDKIVRSIAYNVCESSQTFSHFFLMKQLLETGEKSWQPQDFLPDLTQEGWFDEVKELRKASEGISDEVLVTLIGDMVTEEALPTYQTLLNTFEGCDDPTGTTDSGWAKWSRGWTSEENRHGDLLNKYLYLSGRCDMRAVEVTIQHLITSGFNPEARKDPYRGFVYTSFQERATKVSHGNVAKLARQQGDAKLARICAQIAGDEGRHEKAYQLFTEEILKRDPDGLLAVFGDMMRGQIVMPAVEMTDGHNPTLYEDFSTVAQRIGVYTALDYADIIQHLVKRWDLEHLEGLSSTAEKERDYLCRLPDRYRKLAERSMNKKKKATEDDPAPAVAFSWLGGRAV
jgi:acyl-[acyl-carrier-protein] desaturase